MTPKEVRKLLGLTQAEMAEAVGVKTITVSAWEQGIRSPSGSARKMIEKLVEEKQQKGKIMKYHKTKEAAAIAAAKKQKREKNTAGWWKYRETENGWTVYYDSARERIGADDGFRADPSILNPLA